MSHDPTDLAAEQERLAQRAAANENAGLTETEDWKWLMSTPQGRRIVWRILSLTGLFRSSFTGNSQTFFNEGERHVGLVLQGKIGKADRRQFAAMYQEHFEP